MIANDSVEYAGKTRAGRQPALRFPQTSLRSATELFWIEVLVGYCVPPHQKHLQGFLSPGRQTGIDDRRICPDVYANALEVLCNRVLVCVAAVQGTIPRHASRNDGAEFLIFDLRSEDVDTLAVQVSAKALELRSDCDDESVVDLRGRVPAPSFRPSNRGVRRFEMGQAL